MIYQNAKTVTNLSRRIQCKVALKCFSDACNEKWKFDSDSSKIPWQVSLFGIHTFSLFKDFFHFPPVSWVASVWANVNVIFRVLKKCKKWASRERLEICCKCTWTKSTFPRFADSKVASKARCPFCAFPGNKLYWGLFLDLKKKYILGFNSRFETNYCLKINQVQM